MTSKFVLNMACLWVLVFLSMLGFMYIPDHFPGMADALGWSADELKSHQMWGALICAALLIGPLLVWIDGRNGSARPSGRNEISDIENSPLSLHSDSSFRFGDSSRADDHYDR